MEYIHSLPDGTKLAVWEERNQVMALPIPFRRGAGAAVLARNVLKDLTSTVFRGQVYYACHSLEHRILFGAVWEGAPAAILSDPSDEKQYSGLRLLEWKEELYLFFRARSRGGKSWEIKAMCPLSDREGRVLWEGFSESAEPAYVGGERLMVLVEGKVLTWDGKRPPEQGEFLRYGTGQKARDAILKLEAENRQYRLREKALLKEREKLIKEQEAQIGAVRKQYDELAAYAGELQQEGKRWREKYYRKH